MKKKCGFPTGKSSPVGVNTHKHVRRKKKSKLRDLSARGMGLIRQLGGKEKKIVQDKAGRSKLQVQVPPEPVTPSLLLSSALVTGVRFVEVLQFYVLCKHNLSDQSRQMKKTAHLHMERNSFHHAMESHMAGFVVT